MHEFPESPGVPMVVDMSSDILARRIDYSQFGVVYAGAQKNLGPSGVTVVMINKELVEQGRKDIPFIWQYRTQAAARSLANTAPTFSIYMLRNVLQWLKKEGGVDTIEARNREKAARLYEVLEARSDVFSLKVEKDSRSFMNVVWNLETPELEKRCVKEATDAGLIGLKGHRLVGGMRASIYNAVPLQSVEALCQFLLNFQV
ncbi:MAG: 3-phosphoserine/phosphohydroxythreonine transaminase, partial [Polyangiaceae bacterium]|nr:3-phosphoserine/phosphohydroxythreonine transaminase [Polyangiaceae bacterium]